jgi:hypothetical protein
MLRVGATTTGTTDPRPRRTSADATLGQRFTFLPLACRPSPAQEAPPALQLRNGADNVAVEPAPSRVRNCLD